MFNSYTKIAVVLALVLGSILLVILDFDGDASLISSSKLNSENSLSSSQFEGPRLSEQSTVSKMLNYDLDYNRGNKNGNNGNNNPEVPHARSLYPDKHSVESAEGEHVGELHEFDDSNLLNSFVSDKDEEYLQIAQEYQNQGGIFEWQGFTVLPFTRDKKLWFFKVDVQHARAMLKDFNETYRYQTELLNYYSDVFGDWSDDRYVQVQTLVQEEGEGRQVTISSLECRELRCVATLDFVWLESYVNFVDTIRQTSGYCNCIPMEITFQESRQGIVVFQFLDAN